MDTTASIPFEGLAVGDRRLPGHGDPTAVFDPSTGHVIATVAQATEDDVQQAVKLADDTFRKGSWNQMSPRERGRILHRIAEGIWANLEDLALLESRNVGKPISSARGEMEAVAACFEYYAGAVNKIHGQTIPVAAKGTAMTLREPLGVCALIVPWNYPLLITSWKTAPALAMGNTVIIKPAETTPLTALYLVQIALNAGLPPGVLNVLPGPGNITGESLVNHPLVRKISFTGSTQVGEHIMQQAARGIKRVSLELGGKSANVVFADADIETCASSSIFAVFDNTGQDCCARSRILVERSAFDEFVDTFVKHTEAIRIGLPSNESTQMGPLISPAHHETVTSYLAIGDAEGAERICGGKRPTDQELSSGNYLTPAVYVSVDPKMRIMQEEIFGPVVCIMPFDTEQEAIEIANTSEYGLSGSLWTKDVSRALRVAKRLETGMLSINSNSSVHIEMPFGGIKKSGLGREQGMAALDHFSDYKSIFIAE